MNMHSFNKFNTLYSTTTFLQYYHVNEQMMYRRFIIIRMRLIFLPHERTSENGLIFKDDRMPQNNSSILAWIKNRKTFIFLLISLPCLIISSILTQNNHIYFILEFYFCLFFLFSCRHKINFMILSLSVILTRPILEWINDEKITRTAFPLTFQDFLNFHMHPDLVLEAAGHTGFIKFVILFFFSIFLISFLISFLFLLYDFFKHTKKTLPIALIGVLSLVFISIKYHNNSNELIKKYKDKINSIPETFLILEHKTGIIPFFIFTLKQYLDMDNFNSQKINARSVNNGFFHIKKQSYEELSKEDKNHAYEKFSLAIKKNNDKLNPNIVLFHAESTFDTNFEFDITPATPLKFFTDPSIYANNLYVGIKGAGTWIMEFEALTGINTKLYGLLGQNPDKTLGPYLKNSLPRYLSDQGYQTRAFFPVDNGWRDVKRTYTKYYGFQQLIDGKELNLEQDWQKFSDQAMSTSVLEKFKADPQSPFFLFFVSLENHGPHPCKNFKTDEDLTVRFSSQYSNFKENCALNEYLNRVNSTYQAMKNMEDFLKDEEKKTGRPYIMLIYGDHIPWTFINFNYKKYKKSPDPKTDLFTFVQLRSSSKIERFKIPKDIYLSPWFIPTLISFYVSDKPSDIYLKQNMASAFFCQKEKLYECPYFYADDNISAYKNIISMLP